MKKSIIYSTLLLSVYAGINSAPASCEFFPQYVRLVSQTYERGIIKPKKNEKVISKNEQAKELQSLMQYEIDNYYMLSQALKSINSHDIKENLMKMQNDSLTFIEELSKNIKDLGAVPPSFTRDFKEFFMQGYVAIIGLTSQKNVLRALDSNFETILKAFKRAKKKEISYENKTLIEKIYETKKKQREYIKSQIAV